MPSATQILAGSAPGDSWSRRYSALWRDGHQPNLHTFLATTPELAPDQLVRILHVDQGERWRIGEQVRVETYFHAFPALLNAGDATLDLIYGEYLLREEYGQQPALDEYVQRFPQFAAALS